MLCFIGNLEVFWLCSQRLILKFVSMNWLILKFVSMNWLILKFVSTNWLWYWNLYQWTDCDIEICINELTLILKFVSMNWLILKFVGQCDVKRIMTLLIKTITSSWKVWRTLLSYRAYCDTSDYVCLDLWISSYSIFINIWDTSPSDLSSIWTLVSSIAFPKLNPLRQFWQKHFHWLI